MGALTAVLLQIQEAHLAIQHGDPFSRNKSAYLSETLTCLHISSS